MRFLAWIHRWTGGLIGLLLALLGLTGALLVWKGAWIGLSVGSAGLQDPHDPLALAELTRNIAENSAEPVRSVVFADAETAVHTVRTDGGGGFYAGNDGASLAGWQDVWDRPETFLFDLHHHLLIGGTGETITGIAGLVGLGFVITGIILWWQTRKTFKLRLWPARMTRPAIIRQHRDMGVVLAPLLFLTMLTGVVMTLRPVAEVILMPFSSASEMEAASARPEYKAGPVGDANWPAIFRRAHREFPYAVPRIVSMPRAPGDPVTIRMKQPREWHNNGRTTLWFDGATGELIGKIDALKLPAGSQIDHMAYPVHAAKVGGTVYKISQTLTGLALALLGSLAVWSFWFRRNQPRKRQELASKLR